MENRKGLRDLVQDFELWKLVLASIIGGLVVAWLSPVLRRMPPT